MRPSRADEVAARVVAWHNRHPLALRITSAHVQGVGVVSLPMFGVELAGPGPGPGPAPTGTSPTGHAATLRERAQAQTRTDVPTGAPACAHASPAPAIPADATASTTTGDRDGWRAAFSEDFLPPQTAQAMAAFAVQHGVVESVPATGPRREVLVDDSLPGARERPVMRLVLHTAAIEARSRRLRVLLGGDAAAVLGGRLWSRPRALAAAMAPLVLAAAIFASIQHGASSTADPMAATPVPAQGPATAAARPVLADQPVADAVAVSSAVPPAAPAVPPFAAAAPSQPRDGGRLIDIRPQLSAEAARDAKRAATALRAGQAPPPTSLAAAAAPSRPVVAGPTPALKALAPPPDVAQTPAKGRVYAVVARSMRTRIAAGVMLGLMQGVAIPGKGQRTEVLPDGGGWRAAWWPFDNALDARRAQEVLARAGLPADIVEF